MQKIELHRIFSESPFIHDWYDDSDEACEGECVLWGREDVTIVIDFGGADVSHDLAQQVLTRINQQLDFIQHHRDHITQVAQQHDALPDALLVQWVCFYVEDAEHIFCDFALVGETDDWQECCAEMTLSPENEVIYSGSADN